MEDSGSSSTISSQSESPRTGSAEDVVSLGNSLVQVPKRLYQRLSGRRSLFTQELATSVFGRETLAKATLTGKDAVRERLEIRALLRRKCNNESHKASSNSSQS